MLFTVFLKRFDFDVMFLRLANSPKPKTWNFFEFEIRSILWNYQYSTLNLSVGYDSLNSLNSSNFRFALQTIPFGAILRL